MFTQRKEKPPVKSKNVFSRFSFWYLNDLFSTGRKRPITAEDCFEPGTIQTRLYNNYKNREKFVGFIAGRNSGRILERRVEERNAKFGKGYNQGKQGPNNY